MKITTLKNKINHLIVEIGKTNNPTLLEEALDILLLAAEIERNMEFSQQTKSRKHASDNNIANEINKITRKLLKWAVNPNQTNTKILTLYLKIKRQDGNGLLIKDFFRKYNNAYPNGRNFYNSYNQMKSISEKNNGKIFDEVGGIVEIWQPIREAVEDFERRVLG